MMETFASILPDFIRQAVDALKTASPALLIVAGAALFFFSGAMKWVAKWVGVGLLVYGLLTLLGYL